MCLKGKITKFIGFLLLICSAHAQQLEVRSFSTVVCGNARTEVYLPLLANKRVGVITNVTGVIGQTSIVDSLLKLKVNIKKIFGPEHGFRSDTDAGEKVKNGKDKKTGITVISLYGKNKKPTKEQLADIDVLIYDIQDIGVRFYTYISTMCYAMEACAENKKTFIVFDRPNPNGFYIDGPVMRDEWKSFLGLHNVPLVYGMTCGEYAMMVVGENWLKSKNKCDLKVIKLENYRRECSYDLPVRPSPNIPNSTAVLLYPGLGLFEGSIVSLGRGTEFPFQVIGYPGFRDSSFCFTPKESKVSKTPKYLGVMCCGIDLRKEYYLKKHPHTIDISWLTKMCAAYGRDDFFDDNFNYHAGNAELKEQIRSQTSVAEIRTSWQRSLNDFKAIRMKYLLYPDF